MDSNALKAYPFDQDKITIRFIAKPADPEKPESKPVYVSHKLRRPTLEELIEWDKAQPYETIEVSKRENQIISDDFSASIRLWDKVILEIEGYSQKGGDLSWQEVTDAHRGKIPASHKWTAINGIYRSSAKVEGDESEGFSLDEREWRVRQEIGSPSNPFVVVHTLREPTEMEARKYRRASSSTSFIRGAQKQHLKVTTNLNAHVELYDAVIQSVETGGQAVAPASIDPLFKRQVVAALMDGVDAQLGD